MERAENRNVSHPRLLSLSLPPLCEFDAGHLFWVFLTVFVTSKRS